MKLRTTCPLKFAAGVIVQVPFWLSTTVPAEAMRLEIDSVSPSISVKPASSAAAEIV
ncbi:hypothetical protein WBG79_24615 [Prosthecomicrobium sp. N25]